MAGTLAGRSAELQRGAAAGVARAFDRGSQFGAGLLWPHREHPNATRVAEELKFEKKNTFVGRWMVDFRWTGRCKQTFFCFFSFPFSNFQRTTCRSLTSGHATPHGNSPLWPRSAWSRHVSDGDHGTYGTHGANGTHDESELFEWHRHPRKVKLRSNSNSPSNRARQGRAPSKQSNSPHRKRYGNSLLPAPHMPEDRCFSF